MKKNNILKVTLVIVAILALVLSAFGLNVFRFNAQVTNGGDVSSTEAVNFGSLEVTSFSALLKGEKYTCNKDVDVSEAIRKQEDSRNVDFIQERVCNEESNPCPARSGYCSSGGYCSLCTDEDGEVVSEITDSQTCFALGFGESKTPGA